MISNAGRSTGLAVLGLFTLVSCMPAASPAAAASAAANPSTLATSLCTACQSSAAAADPTGLTASLCAACDSNSDGSDGSDASSGGGGGATASAKPKKKTNHARKHAGRASHRRRGGDEPADEDSDATVDSARLATFAYELVEYGRKSSSAAALRGAAELVGVLGVEKLEVTKETEAAATTAPASAITKPVRDLPTRDALLAEAAAMDGAAPAAATAATTRGAKGGPKSHLDIALGNSTDKFRVVFRGNSPAFVSVVGDGDTDLDCFVTDEDGNLVTSDTNPTDRCSMAWTPVWTGPFTIRVKNLGGGPNLYHLTTN